MGRRVKKFLREFPPTYREIDKLLTRNRIFIDRTKGIGVLAREDAISYGTGPMARASGVVRDLRKDEPYLAYRDLDFQVVCSTGGDCYARYLCRMREMEESVKIIQQAVDKLPGGPVNVESVTDVVLPAKPPVYRSIEGLIQHFEVMMPNRGYEVPHEEVYAATESPNGELGFYIVGDGTRGPIEPGRDRRRSSISACFLISSRVSIERCGGGAGKLNIIAAELDR